jgi:hypothetical protein
MEDEGRDPGASQEACPAEAGEACRVLDRRDQGVHDEEHSAADVAGMRTLGRACGSHAYERRSSGC